VKPGTQRTSAPTPAPAKPPVDEVARERVEAARQLAEARCLTLGEAMDIILDAAGVDGQSGLPLVEGLDVADVARALSESHGIPLADAQAYLFAASRQKFDGHTGGSPYVQPVGISATADSDDDAIMSPTDDSVSVAVREIQKVLINAYGLSPAEAKAKAIAINTQLRKNAA
jgi:hypothetical protein